MKQSISNLCACTILLAMTLFADTRFLLGQETSGTPTEAATPTTSEVAQAVAVTMPASVATPSSVVRSTAGSSWSITMLVPIILGALAYLLLQQGALKSKPYLATGAVALMAAILFAFGFAPASLDSYLLMCFCAVATAGGVSFLVAREPVYAALGFATAVLSTCGVMFMQSALFLAAATMIVYAGATIIIFLFVLMFAQQTDLRTYDVQLNNPVVAAAIGAIMLLTITMCVTGENGFKTASIDASRPYSGADLPAELRSDKSSAFFESRPVEMRSVPGTTSGLGRSLYTDYLIAVELAGTVLLVATIGAIALAQRPVNEGAANESSLGNGSLAKGLKESQA
jgi:NADH-quinone oxidoreductase subunit J